MKTFRLALLSLAVAALLPSVTSCKSDDSPFNWTITNENSKATIQLRLNVEDTRAGELSTSAEDAISKVIVHVFDDQQKLETTIPVSVTSGNNTANFEVSPGLKTLYVVSAKSNVNPSIGTTLTDYENKTLTSSLANLKTTDGFVMVGKSEEQQVMMSASQDNLPSSNIFDIKLVRLLAKAQVKCAGVDGSAFGISFGAASFKAIQLNERMRVVNNGSDVFNEYVDKNRNGTYDNYSLRDDADYVQAVSEFSADGCEYMSENIVSQPKSGNTTFLSIRFATTPVKYYTYNSTTSSVEISADTPTASTTYYAVGLQDKANGVVDYALDLSTKNIITFKNKQDADNYVSSLNNGTTSPATVSQSEAPLKLASRADESSASPAASPFEVLTFTDGYVYYRVNIAHKETSGDSERNVYKVVRNNFYKVNIKSVTSLGFSTEALLRPTNAAAVLDAQGHSWISASISPAQWDEVFQNVDL